MPEKPGDGVERLTPEILAALPFDVELLVEPPDPDPNWHRGALQMYEGLLKDPARLWMGPVAWAIAWIMAESISRELFPQAIGVVEGGIDPDTGESVPGHVAKERIPLKGQTITALMKWASLNGIHEEDRLKLKKAVTFNEQPKTTIDTDEDAAEIVVMRPGHFQLPEAQ